jgi:hypothetical protein
MYIAIFIPDQDGRHRKLSSGFSFLKKKRFLFMGGIGGNIYFGGRAIRSKKIWLTTETLRTLLLGIDIKVMLA